MLNIIFLIFDRWLAQGHIISLLLNCTYFLQYSLRILYYYQDSGQAAFY